MNTLASVRAREAGKLARERYWWALMSREADSQRVAAQKKVKLP